MGFRVKLSDDDIADFEVLRDIAIPTDFGTKIAITGNWVCVNDSDEAVGCGEDLSGRTTKC